MVEAARRRVPRNVGRSRSGTASRSRCSCRVERATNAAPAATDAACATAWRDMYGFVDVDTPPGLWGGYATHLYLAPDAMLLPVPDGLDAGRSRRCSTRSARESGGRSRCRSTAGGESWRCSARAFAGCRRARRRRMAGADARAGDRLRANETSNGSRLRADFGADVTVDVAVDDPVKALAGRDRWTVRGRRGRRDGEGAGRARSSRRGSRRPAAPSSLAGTRGSDDTPGFDAGSRGLQGTAGASARSASTPSRTRAALDVLASGRWPFDELPTDVCVGLEEVEELVRLMAGDVGGVRGSTGREAELTAFPATQAACGRSSAWRLRRSHGRECSGSSLD